MLEQPSYTIHYGHIYDERGELLDEVIILLMKGPHSYTAEDTVEVDCHGGVLVMRRILELIIRQGARPAEPAIIYKAGFFKRKTGSVTGRSSYGCDTGRKSVGS